MYSNMHLNLLKYTLFALLFGLMPYQGFAQKKVKGKVTDEKAKPIRDAQVSIDRSTFVNTNANGEFALNLEKSTNDAPQVVVANKEGLMLKDWQYRNGEIKVTMSPAITIKGRVVSYKGVPLEQVNVIFTNVHRLPPATTDEKGYFSFKIPKGVDYKDATRYVIFDTRKIHFKGAANFEFKLTEGNLIYLIADVIPSPVFKVKIVDDANNPMEKITFYVDDVKYATDVKGEFKPAESANNQSTYRADKFNILSLKYNPNGNIMDVVVTTNQTGETAEQKAKTTLDQQIDAEALGIIEGKKAIEERITRTEKEIEEISNLLRNKENISPEERAQLEEKLKTLQKILNSDTNALKIAQEKAQEAFLRLKKEFILKEEEAQKEKLAREKVQLQNQLIREKSNLNTMIFLVVGGALTLILGIIFFNYRRSNTQRKLLAEKVDEINLKNMMLEESSRILDNKNKQINEKNEQLLEKTEELELKNIKITDSIRYARTIQQSILPSKRLMDSVLKENFVFFEPKDIVSGDFYWFNKIGDEIIIVVADCTGHGVPGAFMTMMGNTLLSQIITHDQITDPAQILTNLHEQVQNNLRQNETQENKDTDGMDVVALNLNLKEKKAIFSGAKNALYYVQNKELVYLKGANLSIGSSLSKKDKSFTNRAIPLQGGETFYLVTDGYQDQLGGNEDPKQRKKYMKTKFMELLERCSTLPLDLQPKLLANEFNAWKGNQEQTDDVTVLGFKIEP
jgi:serine phosphatase RsbU (regulator of sigma subunit)